MSERPRDLRDVSRKVLRSEQAKRWSKKYRTELAASSSSLLSTFAAVRIARPLCSRPLLTATSIRSTLSKHVFKRIPPPLRSLPPASNECRYNFNSFSDCVRHTYKTEGFNGFYRGRSSTPAMGNTNADITIGVWSPLLSITLVRTVSFSIYQKSKYTLDEWIYQSTGSSPLVIANTKDALPTFSTIACFGLSGMAAGAVITAIACKERENNTRIAA
jgi:solute carrier family 25 carnitine/acylcarnitine transporter 20/29